MSLDLEFRLKRQVKRTGTGVFIRESGKNRELETKAEVLKYFPNCDLDSIEEVEYSVDYLWRGNITHNLGRLALHVPIAESSLYYYLWRPEELGFTVVNRNYVEGLKTGLNYLMSNKEYLEEYLTLPDPVTGKRWGEYEDLVDFVNEAYNSIKSVNEPVMIIASR